MERPLLVSMQTSYGGYKILMVCAIKPMRIAARCPQWSGMQT